MNRLIFGGVVMLLVAQTSSADVIHMKNGDRITGTIKKIWDGDAFIDPAYADEFSVKQADIAFIEGDRQFDLELGDGTALVGSLAGSDADGNQIVIVGDEEQAIPLAQLTELEEPEEAFDWETHADLNSTFNSGNTNNSNVTLTADFRLKRNRNTHYLDLLLQNEEQKIEDITAKVQDRQRFRYNYTFEVREPWYIGSSELGRAHI